MTRVAICVGLAHYDSPAVGDLPAAGSDAVAFDALMRDPSLGQACPDRSRLILSPTLAELKTQLADAFAELADDDHFILFIAGHASHLPGGRFVFHCRDTEPARRATTALSERDLRLLMRTGKPIPGLVILDTCHAASFAELRRDQRARGDVDQIEPEEALRGVTIAWACRSREQALEAGGTGLFSGLLRDAMRCGAGLSAEKARMGLPDAVGWIKARLQAQNSNERFWPGLSSIGNAAGPYLCTNVNARPGQPGTSPAAATAAAERKLAQLLAHLVETPEQATDRLERLARTAMGGAPLPDGEPGAILRIVPTRIILNRLLPAIAIPVSVAILGMVIDGPKVIAVAVILALACIPLAAYFSIRRYRGRNAHFLLVTPSGFAHAEGGSDAAPRLQVVAWDAVERLEAVWRDKGGLDRFVVHLRSPIRLMRTGRSASVALGNVCFDNVDYQDGVYAVADTLERYHALGNAIGPQPEPAEQHPRVIGALLLVTVSDYASLPPLASTHLDLALMRDTVRDVVHLTPTCLANPALETLQAELWRVLAAHPAETVILYFSGHGAVLDGELVLAAADSDAKRLATSSFPLSRLQDMAAEARTLHLVLILDCCYAGAAGQTFDLGISGPRASLDRLFQADQSAVSIVAAAADFQLALAMDGAPGLFTAAFATALRTASQSGDTLDRISADAADAVRAQDMGQHVWRFLSDVGGAIVFGGDCPEDHLAAIADQQRARLEQLAPAVEATLKQARASIQPIVDGDTVYAFTTRPDRFVPSSTSPRWGCLFVVTFFSLALSLISFGADHPEYGIAFLIALAVLATGIVVWTTPDRYALRTILASRSGIRIGSTTIAAVDVAAIIAVVRPPGSLHSGDELALKLTNRFGATFVIAHVDHGWTSSLNHIHRILNDCVQHDKAHSVATLLTSDKLRQA